MQYSFIPSDTHTTQAFTHLEQGLDEFLDNYLHCVSELLSKIHNTPNISRISAEGTNHFAIVYGLNCSKLKDSMAGHRSAKWKMMEECFRDIHNIGMGYE